MLLLIHKKACLTFYSRQSLIVGHKINNQKLEKSMAKCLLADTLPMSMHLCGLSEKENINNREQN